MVHLSGLVGADYWRDEKDDVQSAISDNRQLYSSRRKEWLVTEI